MTAAAEVKHVRKSVVYVYLTSRDLLPHVLPVDFIVFFVGVVQQPLCKILPSHGVHSFGELPELHLLDFILEVHHEPERHALLELLRSEVCEGKRGQSKTN